MYHKTKGFIAGVLVALLLVGSVQAFGETSAKSISAVLGNVAVKLDGKAMTGDNIIYNGNLYIRADKISDAMGKSFSWDKQKNTADITVKPAAQPAKTVSYFFRKVNFGMTKDQVIKSEGKKPDTDEGDVISYNTTIVNNGVMLAYAFNGKNQLYGIYIFLKDKHINQNIYIDDYNSFKKVLTDKYGKPSSDDTIWSDDLFRDDPQNYGVAISMGHLAYTAEWIINEAKIVDFLHGDNFEITLMIMMTSTKYPAPATSTGLD